MVVLGLLFILLGALALLTGLFTAGDRGDASLLGIHVGATTVFLVGLIAGVLLLFGFTVLKLGTKRTLKHRREQKQLNDLSTKLHQVEAERTREGEGPTGP